MKGLDRSEVIALLMAATGKDKEAKKLLKEHYKTLDKNKKDDDKI